MYFQQNMLMVRYFLLTRVLRIMKLLHFASIESHVAWLLIISVRNTCHPYIYFPDSNIASAQIWHTSGTCVGWHYVADGLLLRALNKTLNILSKMWSHRFKNYFQIQWLVHHKHKFVPSQTDETLCSQTLVCCRKP